MHICTWTYTSQNILNWEGPQGSLSPDLKWFVHRGIKAMAMVLIAPRSNWAHLRCLHKEIISHLKNRVFQYKFCSILNPASPTTRLLFSVITFNGIQIGQKFSNSKKELFLGHCWSKPDQLCFLSNILGNYEESILLGEYCGITLEKH